MLQHDLRMEKHSSFSRFSRSWCYLLGVLLWSLPFSNARAHPGTAEALARLERENLHAPSPQRSAQIIDILLVQESCASATSFGESALKQFPNDLLISAALVRALLCKKNFSRANQILQQEVSVHGRVLPLDLLQLDLFEATGDTSNVANLGFTIVTTYETVEPDLFLRAANASATTDDLDERSATRILKQGIIRHPVALSLWLALIDHLQKTGKICDAAQTAQELRKNFPTLNKQSWDERERALVEGCRRK